MYSAILFSVDGDWVTDYPSKTKEEVREQLANQGSKWIFYPIEGIIMDLRRWETISQEHVLEMAPPFRFLSRKAVREISSYLKENQEKVVDRLKPGGIERNRRNRKWWKEQIDVITGDKLQDWWTVVEYPYYGEKIWGIDSPLFPTENTAIVRSLYLSAEYNLTTVVIKVQIPRTKKASDNEMVEGYSASKEEDGEIHKDWSI